MKERTYTLTLPEVSPAPVADFEFSADPEWSAQFAAVAERMHPSIRDAAADLVMAVEDVADETRRAWMQRYAEVTLSRAWTVTQQLEQAADSMRAMLNEARQEAHEAPVFDAAE